jgi:predicted O-methyltransferase YrrM/SAM-dependent methyltransferase
MSHCCPVCEHELAGVLAQLPDLEGVFRGLRVCSICDAAVPDYGSDSSEKSREIERQTRFHERLWTISPRESLHDVVGDLRGMLGAISDRIGPPAPGRKVVEIGAGRGALLRALIDEGYMASGCEPSDALVQQARNVLDLDEAVLARTDAVSFLNNLRERGEIVDVVFLWHVLEHVNDAKFIVDQAFDLLSAGGKIFIQVPLLASEYIYPEHIFFPSSATFKWLANQLSGAECDTWSDDTNLFLSVVISKVGERSNKSPVVLGTWLSESMNAMFKNRVGAQSRLLSIRNESERRSVLTEAKASSVGLPEDIVAVTREKQALACQLEEMKELTSMLESKVEALMKSLSEARSQAREYSNRLTDAIGRAERLEDESANLKSQLQVREEQMQSTLAKLNASQYGAQEAMAKIDVLNQERGTLLERMHEAMERNSEVGSALLGAEQLLEQVSARVQVLEDSSRRLRDSIERERTVSVAYKRAADELEFEARLGSATIAALEAELDGSRKILLDQEQLIRTHEQTLGHKFATKLNIIKPLNLQKIEPRDLAVVDTLDENHRSRKFSSREHNRYWWHHTSRTNYVPLLYSRLSASEWALMESWFTDTEKRFSSTGEANIPPLSLLLGLISGNGIHRIVQCGHYVGYSSLMLGFLLRQQNSKNSLFSIDIDPVVTDYTQEWINRAELSDYVQLHLGDSASDGAVAGAEEYLKGRPQLIFIDSSHQYEHTLRELDLWYEQLVEGGLLVLHDTSLFAATFDSTGSGGVLKACTEWCDRNGVSPLSINDFVEGGRPGDVPYLDGCGVTIIQKKSK